MFNKQRLEEIEQRLSVFEVRITHLERRVNTIGNELQKQILDLRQYLKLNYKITPATTTLVKRKE